jgi:amidase
MNSMAMDRRTLMASAAGLAAACAPKAVEPKAAAKSEDALGDSDGVGVAARVRKGEITALEAVDAAIARIERVNPGLNALVTKTFEQARDSAKIAKPEGPFAGVPSLIKDLDDVAGVATTYGSRAFAKNVPEKTSPYIQALFNAGLISLGKSTTPEFGLTATTEPLLGGATRNPWNPDYSCGGSSGGAAAAVAAGMTPLAHASDGGGSIRIPASCCGLFGLKPSRGRTITDGAPTPPVAISVDNCVSHSVRDNAAWLAVTEDTGPEAAWSAIGLVSEPSTVRLRVAVMTADYFGNAPEPDVLAGVEATIKLLTDLGHQVRPGKPALDGRAFADAFGVYWASSAAAVEARVRERVGPNANLDDLLEPLTIGLAAQFRARPKADFDKAVSVLKASEAQYTAFFSEADVLLTPVLAMVPLKIGVLSPTMDFEKNQDLVFRYVGYTPVQNAAGAPGMSVPLHWTKGGLPVGMHFAAAPGRDDLLLRLAYELEEARPWGKRRPPIFAG